MNTILKNSLNVLKPCLSAWRRWRADHRGVAAIEFALVFPVALTMYMGAVEMNQVLSLNRKVNNITAATSDLVAQEKVIDDAKMDEIFAAAASMIVPYSETPVKITVTSVVADINDGATTVAWSDTLNGTARTAGAAITIPNGLVENGGSVIYTEVSYQYDSVIGHFVTDGYTATDEFYARPRRTMQITRN